MILYCCERCAKKAKANNPAFNVGAPVFFLGEVVECDICGEFAQLFWCEDTEDDTSAE